MSPLASDERRALLAIARQSIAGAVVNSRTDAMLSYPLSPLPAAGVFVTLHLGGRLRGCIGRIQPSAPLAETVANVAVSSATEDPRFPPVSADEVGALEIEISLLSPPEPLADPQAVLVGTHGLIVTRGYRRGLLLPQVATQYHWTPQRFLEEACAKAGLEREAWKDPGTRIEVFTAEVFSESDRGADPIPATGAMSSPETS